MSTNNHLSEVLRAKKQIVAHSRKLHSINLNLVFCFGEKLGFRVYYALVALRGLWSGGNYVMLWIELE